MSGKLILALGLLCCIQYTVFAKSSTVACYFTNWTVYRRSLGNFKVENIDPKLCTHIFYAFEGVNADGSFKILDEWGDISLKQIEQVIALKEVNPSLKILVSIGGFGEGSSTFPEVMKSATARINLISTSLVHIQTYGFDGLDIVWEYPITTDKESFARFLEEARPTFKARNLLLTAAVSFSGNTKGDIYDVPALSQNLDMITLLEYDFHGYYDGYTGSNAPLYYSPGDTADPTKELNINASVSHWIAQGADPQKLLLGVPFYGKSYRLSSARQNGLGAPVLGAGPIGQYTQQEGVLGYNEICELQMMGGWAILWEDKQQVPYMYKEDVWISFDNARSMLSKAEYVKGHNLLGVSVWSLGDDDFRGTCTQKKNILLSTLHDSLS